MNWVGDYPEDFAAVSVYFTTHDANGAPVAPLTAFESADVKIYKDGSASQKATTNGLTMTSPFDSLVGLHQLLIDTSNDTGDTGFWVGGHVYSVVLNPDTETVAGQTVLKVIGTFGLALAANGGTGAPSAGTVASAVWDAARASHTTGGSFGEGVASVQGAVTGAVASVSGAVGSIASGGIAAATFATGALDAVWSTATRVLTAGTNIVLAKDTGVTGFNDPTANDNADALLDRAAGVETGRTIRQSLRLMLAALAGKASGLGGTTATFRDTNDTKDRIVATVDADGNRSSVTLDAS